MTSPITILVRGEPIPQPRARGRIAGRHPRQFVQFYTPAVCAVIGHNAKGEPIHGPDQLAPWKRRIASAARLAIPRGTSIAGFGSVDLVFYMPRTKELEKAKHPDGVIPCRSHYSGDVDNLAKAVLDALTTTDVILYGAESGGIWGDDAEVWDLRVRKWYVARGAAPGLRIVIHPAPAASEAPLFAAQETTA